MTTWTKETVPDLPEPSGLGRVVGGVRLVCLVLLTAVGICIFVIGRTLRKLLGRWVQQKLTRSSLTSVLAMFQMLRSSAKYAILPQQIVSATQASTL